MPKLVVYKRDLKALEQAHDVCRIMAAHSPLVKIYGETADMLGKVLELHTAPTAPHDDDEESP